jgi:hypothetical protein
MAPRDDYGYGLEYEPTEEAPEEAWDRRTDYGYGLKYEPRDDTPPSRPREPDPIDDLIGEPGEEVYEAAWRAGLITRDNNDQKTWRQIS